MVNAAATGCKASAHPVVDLNVVSRPVAAQPAGASGSQPAGESGSENNTLLELRNIQFSYATGRHVIDDLSLSVERGSVVGIIGPSGTGKSTLLSIIAGLRKPNSGTVERHFEPGQHPVSMVFQKDTLLPWRTAADNIRLFADFKCHGLRRRWRDVPRQRQNVGARQALEDRVDELLEIGKLGDSRDAYPYQLSGGMRRRLAFLVAVAPSPQLLLLDEPFSSVDEPTRVGIHQDVLRIMQARGMTVVLATHDLAEAITLCDKVIVLSNRPASIASIHQIPFGADRNVLRLRESDEYLSLYGGLWHDLSAQIAASRSAEA